MSEREQQPENEAIRKAAHETANAVHYLIESARAGDFVHVGTIGSTAKAIAEIHQRHVGPVIAALRVRASVAIENQANMAAAADRHIDALRRENSRLTRLLDVERALWSAHSDEWKHHAETAEAERDRARGALKCEWETRKDAERQLADARADSDIVADRQWIAGATAGWNYAESDNRAGLTQCIEARRRELMDAAREKGGAK